MKGGGLELVTVGGAGGRGFMAAGERRGRSL